MPPCLYSFPSPQILNLTRTALRQNFAKILLAALQNSIFYPKPCLLAQNSCDNFAPPLYGFVIDIQHFIAAETMYFRHDEIHRLALCGTSAV
ncbi:hypothetical protein [uncultured Campylobacter sp.]|uniref:hypothetical protein n=1 Tax=uncultured Campylobacter sp. TaxID=218934 RepID=UPI00262A5F86|nr:hypothetical protein [uncultured Campylobacter sp.]